jgi:hypothetical protein
MRRISLAPSTWDPTHSEPDPPASLGGQSVVTPLLIRIEHGANLAIDLDLLCAKPVPTALEEVAHELATRVTVMIHDRTDALSLPLIQTKPMGQGTKPTELQQIRAIAKQPGVLVLGVCVRRTAARRDSEHEDRDRYPVALHARYVHHSSSTAPYETASASSADD